MIRTFVRSVAVAALLSCTANSSIAGVFSKAVGRLPNGSRIAIAPEDVHHECPNGARVPGDWREAEAVVMQALQHEIDDRRNQGWDLGVVASLEASDATSPREEYVERARDAGASCLVMYSASYTHRFVEQVRGHYLIEPGPYGPVRGPWVPPVGDYVQNSPRYVLRLLDTEGRTLGLEAGGASPWLKELLSESPMKIQCPE